jgi:subtilisin family serine protease
MIRPILGAIVLLLIVSTALFAEPAPRVLLQLDDTAAQLARDLDTLPAGLTAAAGPDAQLEPIFYQPNDPDRLASWYEHGLNRWFRVVSNQNAEALLPQLSSGEGILSAEMDQIHHSFAIPDDYDIHNMWGLDIMECPEAWDLYQAESDVLITTIDTGCKITHEDLHANMYVNPGEDLNNNGLWDESDNNGIDDDNNGFIDDLTGWDFVTAPAGGNPADGEDYGPADNMVYPDVHGHGTHVQGTAAATTDNGIGVASASWNVTSFPCRAGFAWLDGGSLQGSGYGSDFMAAIQYATDMGTRVISISFGGSGYQQGYSDVVDYARDNNVILFASAGNNGNSNMNYPAAYDGAIAVVATTPSDNKAGFSTFGTWCGISAPGTGIWSTMVGENYRPEDYVAWQGTSMASPNAASVAAYVISYLPELTDDQVEMVILSSADDLDEGNPSYAGLLGAGRVNARRGIEYALSVTVPLMEYFTADVDRENGIVSLAWYTDPGERDDFMGYNLYRDGELILELTTDVEMDDVLPEPGTYKYVVRGVYGGIETIPLKQNIFYSGLFGLPIVDSYEQPEETPWEIINDRNTRHFTSLPYDGEWAMGASAPANLPDGIQRYFAETQGVQVETWFHLTGYPQSGGEAGAVSLYSDDQRITVYTGHNGMIWVNDTETGQTTEINGPYDVDVYEWYHMSVRYLDGQLEVFVVQDDLRMLVHEVMTVSDLSIDGVRLGSRDLDNGWSFFDVSTIKHFPSELEHFEPVDINSAPYPIVITGGLPRPLSDYEIAVMDGEQVVGAISVDHDVYPLVIHAYEDLGDGQGFTEGNDMTFEIWHTVENAGETLEIGALHTGDGRFGTGNYTRIRLYAPSAVGEPDTELALPLEFEIGNAYPNPFNPSFAVKVAMPTAGELKLAMYNVLGQQVLTQAQNLQSGWHTLSISANQSGGHLAAGVYLLQIQHADQQSVQKVVLTK